MGSLLCISNFHCKSHIQHFPLRQNCAQERRLNHTYWKDTTFQRGQNRISYQLQSLWTSHRSRIHQLEIFWHTLSWEGIPHFVSLGIQKDPQLWHTDKMKSWKILGTRTLCVNLECSNLSWKLLQPLALLCAIPQLYLSCHCPLLHCWWQSNLQALLR